MESLSPVVLDAGPDAARRGWAVDDRVPVELALAYDLANTLDERVFGGYGRFDALDEPEALGDWLVSRHLLDPVGATRVSPADLTLAVDLRDQLRAASRAHTDAPDADARDANAPDANAPDASDARAPGAGPVGFDALAARLPLRVALDERGGLALRPAEAGVPGALARVLADAVTAAGLGLWSRLKMCAAPDCHWVFYDHCKPRTGRWCSTSVCGNRMKTRAYRARLLPTQLA